jgi:hypothetical protein
MNWLKKIFRKKEEKVEKEEEREKEKEIGLEDICGDDKELYEVLSGTVLLFPERLKEGPEDYINKANEFESKKDPIRAKVHYRIAGELALYRKNLELARECFAKCAELTTNEEEKKIFKFWENEERAKVAIEKAAEYYSLPRKES